MLSLLTNMTQVGLYTPAVNYVGIGDMAVLALTGAFFPIVSRMVHERRVSKKELAKYLGYFAVAGLVIVAVTYAFGGELNDLGVRAEIRRVYRVHQHPYHRICREFGNDPNQACCWNATNNQKVPRAECDLSDGGERWAELGLIPAMGALGAAYATTISQSLGALSAYPLRSTSCCGHTIYDKREPLSLCSSLDSDKVTARLKRKKRSDEHRKR